MKDFNMNSQQHHVAAVALLMSTLSEREREVMKQVFLGHDAATIADAQQVTVNTVEAQRARALKKMGARNSVQLAALVKGAKSYHLKRYIQRLQVAQRAPQSQLGVLHFEPADGMTYQSTSAVAMESVNDVVDAADVDDADDAPIILRRYRRKSA